MYRQTVIWSIYKSIRPGQPHSTIHQSKNEAPCDPPQGPITWNLARLYATLKSTSTDPSSPTMSWSPQALCRCTKSQPIDTSGIIHYLCNQHRQFHSGNHFWFNPTRRFWLDLTHRGNCVRLDLTYGFRFNLTQFLTDLIWLTFNVFIFDLNHRIKFPLIKASRSHTLDRVS